MLTCITGRKVQPNYDLIRKPCSYFIPDFSNEDKIIDETGINSNLEILKRHPELENMLPQMEENQVNDRVLSRGASDNELFDSSLPRSMELSEVEEYLSDMEKDVIDDLKSKRGKDYGK